MFLVTKISLQKKDKNRVNVYIDNRFLFALSLEKLFSLGIKKGKELSRQDLSKLLDVVYFEKIYNKSLRLLSLRPRSIDEIKRRIALYLKKLKTDLGGDDLEILISKLILKLAKQNLLNDYSFSLWWIEQRDILKPTGSRLLSLELLKKGISRDVISRVLKEKTSLIKEEQKIKKVLQKKLRTSSNLPLLKRKKRLLDYLYRRGFEPSLSRMLVDQSLSSS